MRTAFFDCYHGATEAMLLGALIDAGGDIERLRDDLQALAPGLVALTVTKVQERGLAVSRVSIKAKDDAIRREMREVATVILKSKLSKSVQERTLRVFHRLAVAWGRLQDQAPEHVVMNEAGSLAAIATVAAVVLLIDQLGLAHLSASPLPIGSGTVKGPEGLMPVPAPQP